MLIALALSVCFGRVSMRGFINILGSNSYYNYFFWAFFILLIYHAIPFEYFRIGSKDPSFSFLRITAQLLLIALIIVNFRLTMILVLNKAGQDKPLRTLNQRIERLIQEHGNQKDFSFGIDPSLKKNFDIPWIIRTDTRKVQAYNYFELLYPKFYKDTHPKYFYTIDEEGNWKLQEMMR